MKPYKEFIGTLQNSGFWLVTVRTVVTTMSYCFFRSKAGPNMKPDARAACSTARRPVFTIPNLLLFQTSDRSRVTNWQGRDDLSGSQINKDSWDPCLNPGSPEVWRAFSWREHTLPTAQIQQPASLKNDCLAAWTPSVFLKNNSLFGYCIAVLGHYFTYFGGPGIWESCRILTEGLLDATRL